MTSRHELSLQEKIQSVYDNKSDNGLSQYKSTGEYNISLSSVSNVLKCITEYLLIRETNPNKRITRKVKAVNAQKMDEHV